MKVLLDGPNQFLLGGEFLLGGGIAGFYHDIVVTLVLTQGFIIQRSEIHLGGSAHGKYFGQLRGVRGQRGVGGRAFQRQRWRVVGVGAQIVHGGIAHMT